MGCVYSPLPPPISRWHRDTHGTRRVLRGKRKPRLWPGARKQQGTDSYSKVSMPPPLSFPLFLPRQILARLLQQYKEKEIGRIYFPLSIAIGRREGDSIICGNFRLQIAHCWFFFLQNLHSLWCATVQFFVNLTGILSFLEIFHGGIRILGRFYEAPGERPRGRVTS